MNKSVVIGVGLVGVIGLCAAGTYASGQMLDNIYPMSIAKLNQSPVMEVEMEQTSSSFFERSHKFMVTLNGEVSLEFTEQVTLLPWGASGEVELVQQGDMFSQLREETTFTELPLEISWHANQLFGNASLEMLMEAFSIESKDPEDSSVAHIKPLSLSVDATVSGYAEMFEFTWQGMEFGDGEGTFVMDEMTAGGVGEENDGVFLMTDGFYKVASVTFHDPDSQTKFNLVDLKFTSRNEKQGENALLENEFAVASFDFSDGQQNISMLDAKFEVTLDNLSWQAMKALQTINQGQMMTDDEATQAFSALFNQGFDVALDTRINDLSVMGPMGAGSGEVSAKGSLVIQPSDFEALQHNPMALMQSLVGELDLSLSQSLADMAADAGAPPYQALADAGYVKVEDGLIKSKLALAAEGLTANGMPLGM
ncbi:DUF945 family protein [Corallincola platygyrae]|uniref:DUF945 family protein n=1 Tax=Corallincola platygyrae TaxID=1193278 RepID=A0ABW4XPQ6_9GAMM